MIDVIWYAGQRGRWDQGFLEAIFDGSMWRTPLEFRHHEDVHAEHLPHGAGAVVVIGARSHVDDVDEINALLARLPWALVVLTGDEEGDFPAERLTHPKMALWVQTPRTSRSYPEISSFVGDMWPPKARSMVGPWALDTVPKASDFFFAGQINHESREQCAHVLRSLEHRGSVITTERFGSGISYEMYLLGLARAKVAPCPTGPFTPDTFRLFEALEAGCIPVVEERAPNVDECGYWDRFFPDAPFVAIDDWAKFPALLDELLAGWPANANRISAWWQSYKRDLAYKFTDQIQELGNPGNPGIPDDEITVIVSTSPSPLHPDTAIIEEVVESVRAQLPDSDIIITIDGVHDELTERQADYDEYVRRLLVLTEHRWANVVPVLSETHQHQANMCKRALAKVRTPYLLFAEHDTPLLGEIPWPGLIRAMDHFDAIRLHYDSSIHPEHDYLMLDPIVFEYDGVPLRRTVQWSQRPHLARTDFYRKIMLEFFGVQSRTMIEDVMHGVVRNRWREFGEVGAAQFRLAIYSPPGDMQRSEHLDARADDPELPNKYRYDGETPFGAPAPT
jgi:hypothetical protein